MQPPHAVMLVAFFRVLNKAFCTIAADNILTSVGRSAMTETILARKMETRGK
jgi:hypothetical protein